MRARNSSPSNIDNFELQRGEVAQVAYRLVGTEALVVHQWGQKAVIQLLSKMVGADMVRLPKDLTQEYEESSYKNEKGDHVIPCRIIKAAAVEGAISSGKAISKAELKRGLRVLGWTAPIQNAEPQMDVRMVGVGINGTDVRARAMYPAGWFVEIVTRFYPKILSPAKVTAALRLAGEDIGLCEMRVSKGFEFGSFKVEAVEESRIPSIIKACGSHERMFEIPQELLHAAGASPKQTDESKKVLSLSKQRKAS